jgi:hypothetical protein
MPWETIECSDGAWEINREGVMRIMRSHAWSRAVVANSSITREAHHIGPDIDSVDTDWPAVRKDTNETAQAFYEDLFAQLAADGKGADAQDKLADLVAQKDSFENQFTRMQKDAQRTTMHNIQMSVEMGEDALPVLEFLRDTSIDTFLIGATVLSGGTLTPGIAGLLGAGSVAKGVAKWEDTGRVGDAVVEASTEFIFGLVGVGVRGLKASGAMKWALAVAIALNKAEIEVIKQSMAGKNAFQSGGRGVVKLIDPFLGEIAKQVIATQQWAIPVTAILKYAAKKVADMVTTPAKAGQEKPRLVVLELADVARPNDDFVKATALQRFPGMSRPL